MPLYEYLRDNWKRWLRAFKRYVLPIPVAASVLYGAYYVHKEYGAVRGSVATVISEADSVPIYARAFDNATCGSARQCDRFHVVGFGLNGRTRVSSTQDASGIKGWIHNKALYASSRDLMIGFRKSGPGSYSLPADINIYPDRTSIGRPSEYVGHFRIAYKPSRAHPPYQVLTSIPLEGGGDDVKILIFKYDKEANRYRPKTGWVRVVGDRDFEYYQEWRREEFRRLTEAGRKDLSPELLKAREAYIADDGNWDPESGQGFVPVELLGIGK